MSRKGNGGKAIDISLSANAQRANDIFREVQKKSYESHFLCPDAIDPYEKPIQRPTFNGKLDVSWVREQ